MRKFFFIASLFFIPTLLGAKNIELSVAHKAAQNFWQNTLEQRGHLSAIPYNIEGLYVFTAPQGGFVVMSSNDAVRPLLAYATHGMIDTNNLPIQLADLLRWYGAQIKAAEHQQITATEADQQRWHTLLYATPSKGGSSVDPLLETLWDQDPYYNKFCPYNTVAGCAAIAQAQLMRYWKWPYFGNGNHTYKHSTFGTLSADFKHTIYQWDMMPNQLTSSTPVEQVDATALFIYHVGVSLEMDYNYAVNGGSGALGLLGQPGYPSIDNSLKDYFRFNPNMKPIFKDYGYTDSAWAADIIDELELGHPVLYCGISTAGGHAFVCDGYEKRLDAPYFHFNFGWSGIGDGYFTVDNISPNVSPTGEVGQTYYFVYSNQALLGGIPDYKMLVSDTLLSFSQNGNTDTLYFSANPAIDAAWTASCDQPWVELADTSFNLNGPIAITTLPNNTGIERQANISFSQGDATLTVRVVQTAYSDEELCPLTVEMQSDRGKGWRGGAYLSFESPNGYLYASTTLEEGGSATTTVNVAPANIDIIFHHGGGTDREISYRVLNSYDEVLVDVDYAYKNGGTHHIDWPCAHVSINDIEPQNIVIAPNPVCDFITITGTTCGDELVLSDIIGQTLLKCKADESVSTIDMRNQPAGIYFLRIGSQVHRIVKK